MRKSLRSYNGQEQAVCANQLKVCAAQFQLGMFRQVNVSFSTDESLITTEDLPMVVIMSARAALVDHSIRLGSEKTNAETIHLPASSTANTWCDDKQPARTVSRLVSS
jgi:hypothetical protein